jgi:hypothetical protein
LKSLCTGGRQEVIANWKEARKAWLQESKAVQLADVLIL